MPGNTHNPIIAFKKVTRDGTDFIEVSAGSVKASKGNGNAANVDDITWIILNHTDSDVEVAVVDFWSPSGGVPFALGNIPEPSGNVAKRAGVGKPGTGKIENIKDNNGNNVKIKSDGDEGVFKYTIVARLHPADPWVNVKDPELEIEP